MASSQSSRKSPVSSGSSTLRFVALAGLLVVAGGTIFGLYSRKSSASRETHRLSEPAPETTEDADEHPHRATRTLRVLQKPTPFKSFDGSIKECDVLVVGGTPAGIAAALAASRRGADVVLIEERAHLGGDIVYQMMNMWDVPLRPGTKAPVVQGIFAEFFDQLGLAFDIGKAMHLFEESCAIEPALHTFVNTRVGRVLKEDNRVVGAIVRGDDGPEYQIKAKAIVDATDDATFAARGGAGYFIGRQKINSDKAMQAAGLLFSVKNVSWPKIVRYCHSVRYRPMTAREVNRVRYAIDLKPIETPQGMMVMERLGGGTGNYLWERGNAVKDYQPLGPNIQILSINFGKQRDGSVVLNALNIYGVNGLSARSMAAGEQEMLQELPHFVEYLRKTVPGFEKAEIGEIAPELYIRETRHIQGLYMLTQNDIATETRFPDRVALASYPMDLHPYKRGEANPLAPMRYNYTIPLGCLIPKRIDGVFVASRSISATSVAAGSARVLPITMACGEAAGAAAWLCAQRDCTPQVLANDPNLVAQLQDTLRDWGADIGNKFPTRAVPFINKMPSRALALGAKFHPTPTPKPQRPKPAPVVAE